MKVLHIIYSLIFGGIESGVIRIASEQGKDQKNSVVIVCVGSSSGPRAGNLSNVVNVELIPFWGGLKLKFLKSLGLLLFFKNFTLYLRNIRPDVVHVHLNLVNFVIVILTKTVVPNSKIVCSSYTTHNIFKVLT